MKFITLSSWYPREPAHPPYSKIVYVKCNTIEQISHLFSVFLIKENVHMNFWC